ncbi:hypothetical protein [Pseudoalteromonas lipolytica]|uniref:hypothetical protein n=1 Tax=Pseudoalteromonas lipolytica TaxID=570156 RepID=UPI00241BFEA7|nr:hypothetical protein [Pseudoalteromonas lipolytica]|tara:strand:+ start:286 stop:1047 length:762 start_codon:yes stop_codon:yes gene_type:complete
MSDLFQDTKIIAALFTAATALIIASTSAFAFFYRSRRDDKRNAKKVLFLLLEVRHAIKLKTLPIDEVAKEYCEYAAKKLNSFTTGEVNISSESFDFQLIKRILSEQLASIEENLADGVIPSLNEKLTDLAEDNPILAFKIRGRDNFLKLFETSKTQIMNFPISNTELPPDNEKALLECIGKIMLLRAAKESNLHIDAAIDEIARYCGQSQFKKWHKLKKETASEHGFDFTLLDDFFESCYLAMVELKYSEIKK